MKKRLHEIDALRGLALVAMIVFHFFFDLDFLGISSREMYEGGWLVLARAGQFLFLGLAGFSVALSSRGFGGQCKRAAGIFLAGMLVSLATWIFAPEQFVKFGVLYFIAVAIPIAYLFKGRSAFLALGAAVLAFDLGMTFNGVVVESRWLFPLGLTYANFASLDYFPIFPWISAVLVGLVAGRWYLKKVDLNFRPVPVLGRMGRHSLLIYLTHQPILILGILFYVSVVPVSAEPFVVEECELRSPWNGDLIISSMDRIGSRIGEERIFVKSGGVPTIIQDSNGRLISAFQWFNCGASGVFDKIAVKISEDGGLTWSDPEPVVIEGMPETYRRAFDPTLTLTDDGKIRLYFTSSATMAERPDASMKIYSAISDDGVNYAFEPGVRFGLEDGPVNDSAVGRFGGLWYLITPKFDFPKGARFAVSEDGLTFTTRDDIILDGEVNWTGNFFAAADALYFYGTPNWYTQTTDGKTWAAALPLKTNFGADPAVYCPASGDCLIVATKVSSETQGRELR